MNEKELILRRWNIIESLQMNIIKSGSAFIPSTKLEKMEFGQLLDMALPNLITFQIGYDSDAYVKSQETHHP